MTTNPRISKTARREAKSEPRAGKPAPTEKLQNYATPALEKGLDVLEMLAHQPAGLTKSQIARKLNRTVSEIFRMLLCLERRGYIAQVAEDRYSLTLKLFKLVQEHPPTERLLTDALPVLHRLARDTMQSCHLGVLESDSVVILAQVNAPASHGFYVKLGSSVDLMEATSGYVILAFLDPGQRESAIADWLRETGRKTPRDLAAHLARIRATGYEKRESYLVKGVVNISFPVLDERGSALGALTVPYLQYNGNTRTIDQVLKDARTAAAEITTSIGGKLPR